ncbi:MAG: divergent polysaccharide deacetylase family protein [Candidatus Caldatribacteriaceae bacterium]
MKWLRKSTFWILIALLAVGVYLFSEGLREGSSFSHLALAQVFSQGMDRFCAAVILQELRLQALRVEEVAPKMEGEVWQVRAVFGSAEERKLFSDRMANFLKLLPYLGFSGERTMEGKEETYTLFFRAKPWFLLHLAVATRFQVALVIDDLGYDLRMAEKILDLPVKLNVAILPHLAHTQDVARLAKEKGREILIHFPMEAMDGGQNSKEGFLLRVGASAERVRELLDQACATIPGARGLNNHKGSRATSDPELMKVFFAHLKGRGLYFLDSLTASHSVAFQTARKAGIPAFRRDVFLDTYPSVEYVKSQLRATVGIARKRGYAIAIGHPRESTYRAIADFLKNFSDPEVEFVFLSEIQKKESM